MDEMTGRPVSFVKWDDLPYSRRLQLCEMASYASTCARRQWNEWMPADRIRLASALAELSGRVAAFEEDTDTLEQRRWNDTTESERRAEYDELDGD
jgi:hypothetical protein